MPKLIGYMWRPPNESHYATAADEKFCRDLAHQIFGTSTRYEDTAFCETHAFWWLMLCLIVPSWRDSITDLLEVWDLRESPS